MSTDLPSGFAIAANPVPIEPGPDLHVRKFLHATFDAHAQKGRLFNINDWSDWSEAEIAEVVRCVARDYLDGNGNGFDWVSAAERAEFVMAGVYNEVASESGNWPAPVMMVNFYDPFIGEGIELQMGPPLDIEMDPIPGMAPVDPDAVVASSRAQAPLRLSPPGDAMKAVDGALVEGVNQLGTFFANKGRLPLMMVGAMLTLWRGLQASHHVRGGAVYRDIHDPSRPELQRGDMQILFSRSSERINGVIAANPEEATLFLA